MSATVALRPVTAGDDAFLFRVYASTRADEMAVVPWDDRQKQAFLDMQFRAQSTDYTTRFPDAEHSIVLVDGEPAGRIWIDRRADEIRLLDIALLPERRNAGTGGELLRRLQEEARRSGLPLRHSVEKDNSAGLRFYERLGFTVIEDWGLHDLMEWAPPGISPPSG